MPTYDYICTSCNNTWELEQRIVEDAIKVCPTCGAATAKRQISSGAGFILKGGGWYADGYGSKAPSSASDDSGAKADKPEKKDTAASDKNDKSEKKTESAPAAESPAKKTEKASSSEGSTSTSTTPVKPSAA